MKLPIIALVILILSGCSEKNEVQPEPIPQFDISKAENALYAGSGFVVVDYSQNAETIEWDFGDGTVSQDSIVVHAYREKGVYQLKLTTCNSSGCEDVSIQLVVKDSIMNLLAGSESKTWFLSSWIDANDNPVDFDPCLSCLYSQRFYANGDVPYFDGEHKWLNNGLVVCGDNSVQCNTYGAEGHGWFDLELDPFNRQNHILIGQAGRSGYTFTVDENQLYLKSNITGDEFYYTNTP